MNRQKVIAIDGPGASGKGTVASRVAAALGYDYLDSGALYRLTGTAFPNLPEVDRPYLQDTAPYLTEKTFQTAYGQKP